VGGGGGGGGGGWGGGGGGGGGGVGGILREPEWVGKKYQRSRLAFGKKKKGGDAEKVKGNESGRLHRIPGEKPIAQSLRVCEGAERSLAPN